MGFFKKVGGFFKKQGAKIGKGVLKVASVATSILPIPGGGLISKGLSGASNLIKTPSQSSVGALGQNTMPSVGGLGFQGKGSIGGIDISVNDKPVKDPSIEEKEKGSSTGKDLVKWGAIGFATKMLLGI